MKNPIEKYARDPDPAPAHSSQPFAAQSREARILRKTRGSYERFQRAAASLSGGVSSGLRRQARPYPLYFSAGRGAQLQDVDGNCYLDYSLGWGPNILGNAPECVVAAIQQTIR